MRKSISSPSAMTIGSGVRMDGAVEGGGGGGGCVAGIAAINMDDNPGVRRLREKYMCFAVMNCC